MRDRYTYAIVGPPIPMDMDDASGRLHERRVADYTGTIVWLRENHEIKNPKIEFCLRLRRKKFINCEVRKLQDPELFGQAMYLRVGDFLRVSGHKDISEYETRKGLRKTSYKLLVGWMSLTTRNILAILDLLHETAGAGIAEDVTESAEESTDEDLLPDDAYDAEDTDRTFY